jgi:hypothetical protein
MPSPPGYMKSRSVTNHAGVPQIVTTTFIAAPGSTSVVTGSTLTGGQRIRLHSFMMAPTAAGAITLASSGDSAETSLIGHIEVAADTPISQDGGLIYGLATCPVGTDLTVSAATTNVRGNLSYSIVP